MNETAIAATRDYVSNARVILDAVVHLWDVTPDRQKKEVVKKAAELIGIAEERLNATCGDEGRNYRKVLRW